MSASSEELFETLQNSLKNSKNLLEELSWHKNREDYLHDIERSLKNLTEKFKIVVVGDYNSGKSYFINTLLGEMVSKVSNMPETERVHIYRYGSQENEINQKELVWTHYKINPVLEHFDLVDTPGLNSGDSQQTQEGDFHGDMTREFIPSADVVFYISSIVNSWSASGKALLNYIYNEKCRQIVLILNKIDILDEPDPLDKRTPEEKVKANVDEVRFRCREQLDLNPTIFAVSSMRAYRARTTDHPNRESVALFEKSCFTEVTDYIQNALNDVGRIRLKLQAGTHLTKEIIKQTQLDIKEELSHAQKEKEKFEKELNGVHEVKKWPHQLQTKLKERAEELLHHESFQADLKKEFISFWKQFKIGMREIPKDTGLEQAINDTLDLLNQKLAEEMEPFHQEIHQKLELNKTWMLPKVRLPIEPFMKNCFTEFTVSYMAPIITGVFFLIGVIGGFNWLWFLSLLALGGIGAYVYHAQERCLEELKTEIVRYQRNAMSPFREQIQDELEPTINNFEMVLKEELNKLRLQMEELEQQEKTSSELYETLSSLHQTLETWRG